SALFKPFTEGGICGDFVYSLTQAVKDKDIGVKVILPLYFSIPAGVKSKLGYISKIDAHMLKCKYAAALYGYKKDNIEYIFIENDYYFGRKGIFGHYDDGERFAFFCRAAIEVAKLTGNCVLHCADWHTALIPVYIKCDEGCKIKTVFTLCDILSQGNFCTDIMESSLLLQKDCLSLVEWDGNVNLLKGGISCADAVTALSPSYLKHIRQKGNYELEPVLNNNNITAILGGIDCNVYNPQKNKALPQNYSANSLEGKAACKTEMQAQLKLCRDKDIPLITFYGQLIKERGAELLINTLPQLLKLNIQVAVIGSGDINYENALLEYCKTYKGKMGVMITDKSDCEHKISAAADIALLPHMPLYYSEDAAKALIYGTVCIASKTGALADRVKNGVNGFILENLSEKEIFNKVSTAVNYYADKNAWKKLVISAMGGDYTFAKGAEKYIKLWESLL
ncbi:MAG: glycogen/starch synthase, partial [Clostridia bacterium]|nr:glycogen/starch synthase [Clostridia bacterium]